MPILVDDRDGLEEEVDQGIVEGCDPSSTRVAEMHTALIKELFRLLEQHPDRCEFMCRIACQLTTEYRDMLKRLGMRFNSFVASHPERFEVTGFRSMQRMRGRLPEETRSKASPSVEGGVEVLRQELRSILQRHRRPILMSVVGSSLSAVGHQTLRSEGIRLKQFFILFPDFRLSSNLQGKEQVSLVPAGEQAETVEDQRVRRVADEEVPLDPRDAVLVKRRSKEAPPVAVVPAHAYPETYVTPQWSEPDTSAGAVWHEGRPKGKGKGEPKGGNGDFVRAKGGYTTAPIGSPVNPNAYAGKRYPNWGGKTGSLPPDNGQRVNGGGKDYYRNGVPLPPGAKRVTDGWEPLFRADEDGMRVGPGNPDNVFYDIGHDLLPNEYLRGKGRPASRGEPGWAESSWGLAR
jgi:hypothetical protein